jgi:hypothetical protein
MRLSRSRELARRVAGMGIWMLLVSGASLVHHQVANAQVQEIPVRGMRGIASVGYRGNTLTIEPELFTTTGAWFRH